MDDDNDYDMGVGLEAILEPKDPYLFRPLPHLIGSSDFMDDDYVGLGDLLIVQEPDIYGHQIQNEESDLVRKRDSSSSLLNTFSI